MREYTYQHVVTLRETNLVGNVYFAEFAAWQGACRERFLMDECSSVMEELAARSLALVTIRIEIDFMVECFAGDRLEIAMRAGDYSRRGRAEMLFDYRRDGVTVATGRQMVCSLRPNERGVPEPADLPKEFHAALQRFRG